MFKICAALICIFLVYKTAGTSFYHPRPNIYITRAEPRYVVPQNLWNVMSRVIQYTEPRYVYQQNYRQHKSLSNNPIQEQSLKKPTFSQIQTIGDIPLGRSENLQQFEPKNVNFIPKNQQFDSIFSKSQPKNQPKISIIKAQEIGDFIRNDPTIINDERLARLNNQAQFKIDQPQFKIASRQFEIEQPNFDQSQIHSRQFEIEQPNFDQPQIDLRQFEIEQPNFDQSQIDSRQFEIEQPNFDQPQIDLRQFEIEQPHFDQWQIDSPQFDDQEISQPQYKIDLRQSEIEQPQFDEFQFDFDPPQIDQSQLESNLDQNFKNTESKINEFVKQNYS